MLLVPLPIHVHNVYRVMYGMWLYALDNANLSINIILAQLVWIALIQTALLAIHRVNVRLAINNISFKTIVPVQIYALYQEPIITEQTKSALIVLISAKFVRMDRLVLNATLDSFIIPQINVNPNATALLIIILL